MTKQANPRRAELRELSAMIQPQVKAGLFATVNEGLISIYTDQTGQSVWHTFHDWKEAGKCVRKGERGFPIWARPRSLDKGDDSAQPGEVSLKDKPEFFPVCYLFHAGQVEESEKVAA